MFINSVIASVSHSEAADTWAALFQINRQSFTLVTIENRVLDLNNLHKKNSYWKIQILLVTDSLEMS